jgi:hypothetical protein
MLNLADKHGNKAIEVFDSQYDNQVRQMATHLRKEDFDEAFATTGESPHLGVKESWDNSIRKWIIFKGDAPVGAFGVRPLTMFSDIGIVWLLGTDGLSKIKKFFVKISKPIIAEMMNDFKILVNFVDMRYTKAVRWLKWCGFQFDEPAPFGALGLPFSKFYMERV